MSHYDAFVIGAGPGGEVVVARLKDAGLNVAIAERELLGGECGSWGCIPSKTLLRPVEAAAEAQRTWGVAKPDVDWGPVREYRDYMIRDLDDSDEIESYAEKDIKVFKDAARIAGPGKVEVGGETHDADRIILATGSDAVIPPIDGLEEAGYWTNREATTFKTVPESVVMLGGGPIGIELGQMFARYGARVTLVESQERLLAREDEAIGELLKETLEDDDIDVRLGSKAVSVERTSTGRIVRLADGGTAEGQELVVAIGRKPRTAGLGIEEVGGSLDEKGGVEIDERCRAAENVWAVGDMTGIAPFTHVAKYQGRLVVADITGKYEPKADYTAIPRVVFSDPEVAAVGLTEEQAKEQGIDLVTECLDLSGVGRSHTYEREPRGRMCILADRERRVLVGAWAVGPMASEWIHLATLAVKAAIPIEVLRDTVAQFPTYAEAYVFVLETIDL
ncbi:MAG: NAD(P)/FAD-dependent oxidoreductase [Thermoleophilaceae bacterium]|nr:NAD(P)/FAD-dependent oxidoreductase [Thermoleophilaceae bacterium]